MYIIHISKFNLKEAKSWVLQLSVTALPGRHRAKKQSKTHLPRASFNDVLLTPFYTYLPPLTFKEILAEETKKRDQWQKLS